MLQQIDNKAAAINIHRIVDRLRIYEGVAKINMNYAVMPTVDKHGCKTPGCFVGWYYHDLNYYIDMLTEERISAFSEGIDAFEREVFDLSENYEPLVFQFDTFIENSGLWPNKHGISAFISTVAYTGKEYSAINLCQILDCWGKFANNLNASTKKYFIEVY